MIDREELIKSNLSLVHYCARRFINRGVEYEDLYQAGCIGLVKAVNGFDESLGFVFSTYAVPAILGEIRRIFRDGGAVKVSRGTKEKSRLLWQEKEKLSLILSREPTVNELADFVHMEVCEVSRLLLVFQPVLSLTALDEETQGVLDVPVEEQEEIDEALCLRECIDALCEEDKRIIDLRYFQGKTQAKVAKELSMTQVQVSRREKKILKEIRQKMLV